MKKLLGLVLGMTMIALTPAIGNAAEMIEVNCSKFAGVSNVSFLLEKLNKRQDRIEDEKEILEAKEKAEAERPKKEFLEACIGSRHTVESAAASGSKRAKEGVKKSSSTCRSEWRALDD